MYKEYFKYLLGLALGLAGNIEIFFLKSNLQVSERFVFEIFDVKRYMENRELFLTIKITLILIIFVTLICDDVKMHHTSYELIRQKIIIWYEAKLTAGLIVKSAIFWFGFSIGTVIACISTCIPSFQSRDFAIILLASIGLLYSGCFFALVSTLLSLKIQRNIVVLLSGMIIVLFALLTKYVEITVISPQSLYSINPITSVSLAYLTESEIYLAIIVNIAIVTVLYWIVVISFTRRKRLVKDNS